MNAPFAQQSIAEWEIDNPQWGTLEVGIVHEMRKILRSEFADEEKFKKLIAGIRRMDNELCVIKYCRSADDQLQAGDHEHP